MWDKQKWYKKRKDWSANKSFRVEIEGSTKRHLVWIDWPVEFFWNYFHIPRWKRRSWQSFQVCQTTLERYRSTTWLFKPRSRAFGKATSTSRASHPAIRPRYVGSTEFWPKPIPKLFSENKFFEIDTFFPRPSFLKPKLFLRPYFSKPKASINWQKYPDRDRNRMEYKWVG